MFVCVYIYISASSVKSTPDGILETDSYICKGVCLFVCLWIHTYIRGAMRTPMESLGFGVPEQEICRMIFGFFIRNKKKIHKKISKEVFLSTQCVVNALGRRGVEFVVTSMS